LRASLDHRPEKIGSKIRDAQHDQIPVMLVVGAKEAENQAVSYRDRRQGDLGAMPLSQALARLQEQMEIRKVDPVAPLVAPALAEEGAEQHNY
jgi:threonyl-tRNA synthetase